MKCENCGHISSVHTGYARKCRKGDCFCEKFIAPGSAALPATFVETLRDRFAMAALTGILSNSHDDGLSTELVASACYDYADAMMEARNDQ